MKRIIILAAILFSTAGYAAIYVNQTSNGSVEYSDTPSANAKVVQAEPLNTVSSPAPVQAPATAAPANSGTAKDAAAPESNAAVSTTSTYTKFVITSPADGETIQNQPVIPVSMAVEPNLTAGDKIQLYLDGKAVGTPTSTIYQELGIVDRGTHTLYGEIKNSSNQGVKKSNTLTIYVHRNSVITSPQTSPK